MRLRLNCPPHESPLDNGSYPLTDYASKVLINLKPSSKDLNTTTFQVGYYKNYIIFTYLYTTRANNIIICNLHMNNSI